MAGRVGSNPQEGGVAAGVVGNGEPFVHAVGCLRPLEVGREAERVDYPDRLPGMWVFVEEGAEAGFEVVGGGGVRNGEVEVWNAFCVIRLSATGLYFRCAQRRRKLVEEKSDGVRNVRLQA